MYFESYSQTLVTPFDEHHLPKLNQEPLARLTAAHGSPTRFPRQYRPRPQASPSCSPACRDRSIKRSLTGSLGTDKFPDANVAGTHVRSAENANVTL